MPDMSLPPVPAAPAPTKTAPSAARSADAQAERASDKDFSRVLDSQMQSEQDTAEPAAATDTRADAAGDTPAESAESAQSGAARDPAAAASAGNPLPADGKPTDVAVTAAVDPLAALLPLTEAATPEQIPGDTPSETVAAALPAQSGVPAPVAAVAAKPAPKPAATTTADALNLRANGPWKTGAAAGAEPAENGLAQAVRNAVAGSETAPAQTPLERFGTEVRAAALAARPPVGEAALERLTAGGTGSASGLGNGPATQVAAGVPLTETAPARSALPTTAVDTPLRQPGWDQALSERVMWVANQKFQGAEIKLNPAHLGPIEVRVQLHQDQAQISFTAQHAPAREALEAALPRLREMFAASGYSQVDVNVSQHSFADQQRQAQGFESRPAGGMLGGDGTAGDAEPQLMPGRVAGFGAGAIDLFA